MWYMYDIYACVCSLSGVIRYTTIDDDTQLKTNA